MQHLADLNTLIDKAADHAGSDYKLAQQLDVSRQTISNWRHGRKTATPADRALMAAVAGLDPVAELARATVQQHEGRKKGDQLMRALGKALLVTGAGIGSAGASAAAIFSSIPTHTRAAEWVLSALYTMYIM
ncbi:YdaS family helix-turn-helix protein [Paracidovorax wautersii]|uniref:YdaS family helix-turn-helix protein n=1 Tax=Paracidovorax wautersii TaxID=1177982 RepID=UPI0031CF114E